MLIILSSEDAKTYNDWLRRFEIINRRNSTFNERWEAWHCLRTNKVPSWLRQNIITLD